MNTVPIRLSALPHRLTIDGYPQSGRASISRKGEILYQGDIPVTMDVLAGEIKVALYEDGRELKQRSFVHDGDRKEFFCLDHFGQLLACERQINVGPAPKAVAFSPDGTQIWTALLAGPTSVEVYSSDTGEQLASIMLEKHGAVELEFSQDGRRVWASQMNTSSVFEIDAATFEVLRQLPSRSSWSKVLEKSYDGQHLYVSIGWVIMYRRLIWQQEVFLDFETFTPRGLWVTQTAAIST